MLGRREAFDAVPFFWSRHYHAAVNYVGHAENFDAVTIDGSVADGNATINYQRKGRTLAVATIDRDLTSLRAEADMETVIA